MSMGCKRAREAKGLEAAKGDGGERVGCGERAREAKGWGLRRRKGLGAAGWGGLHRVYQWQFTGIDATPPFASVHLCLVPLPSFPLLLPNPTLCSARASERAGDAEHQAHAHRHEQRGGHCQPGERGRGSGGVVRSRRDGGRDGDGEGRDGRCGGGGSGVGGDGGACPTHPPSHRELHSPGVGDAGGRARAVQGPRRRLRGPPLLDPQGEGGEVGGGDPGAARPRRRRRAGPRLPPRRPAPPPPHRPPLDHQTGFDFDFSHLLHLFHSIFRQANVSLNRVCGFGSVTGSSSSLLK